MVGRTWNLNEQIKQHKEQSDSLTNTNHVRECEMRIRRDKLSHEINKIEERRELFESTLGLKMCRKDEGNLRFIFTCISESKPDEEYSFNLNVQENGNQNRIIVATSCKPRLENISELNEGLRLENNIASFLFKIRKEFKKIS